MSDPNQNNNHTTGGAASIGSEDPRKRPYRLSLMTIQILQNGWWRFVVVGRKTIRAGYFCTMVSYFAEGERTLGGVAVPILLPQWQRPSLKQFSYCGKRVVADRSHWQLRVRRIAPKPGDIP